MPRRRSITQTGMNFSFLILAVGKMLARYAGATYRDRLEEAKLQKVQTDAQLSEMRRQKVANELVLQDLKIEQKKRDLGIPTETTGWEPFPD